MQQGQTKRTISRIYLILIPFLAVAIGFGVGHSSYKIYIPLWLLNCCLMAAAIWVVSGGVMSGQDPDKKDLAFTGLFMVLPWAFFAIFAGMGPPPSTAAGWVAAATEQQMRYYILILGGVLLAVGSALLKQRLKNVYSVIGHTVLMIAIPLFIINMAFWGNYLVEAFRGFVALGAPAKRPDWFAPVRELFYSISVIELALIYLATAAFAVSLRAARLLSPGGCKVYIIMSLLMCVLNMLPPSLGEPFETASFLVSVPAIPFIMPYLMGVHLLWRSGMIMYIK
jgi:hypothetical protein